MRTLLLCSCFLIIGHLLYAQSEWEMDKNENDITVYTRYEEDSDFKAFKAITTLRATVDQVVGILRDAENYTEWYGYTRTSKVLKREKNIQYNYVETIFPWPFSNRDMVYKMTIDTSHSSEVSLWKVCPTTYPKNKESSE